MAASQICKSLRRCLGSILATQSSKSGQALCKVTLELGLGQALSQQLGHLAVRLSVCHAGLEVLLSLQDREMLNS